MGVKKFAIYAGLLLVIIVAVVIAARRTTGQRPMPNWLLDQQVQKIDRKTLELITEPNRDWLGKHAGDSSNYGDFKNPKTGTYTMVDPIHCGACGELIPPADYSPIHKKGVQGAEVDALLAQIEAAYKCPKCGKNPFRGAPGGPPP